MRNKPFKAFRYRFFFFLLGLLALAGCGGQNLVDVKGKVYYGGQPLKATGLNQAIVQFYKQGEGSDNKMYQGNFDEQGNYTINVPPGKYKVLVIATKTPKGKGGPPGAGEYAVPVSVIPNAYSDLKLTDKFVEVATDSKPGDYDIKLAKSN